MEKHPSYGLLAFSRVSGGESTLFGSSIKHNERIRMEVKRARIDRHLNNDWFHESGPPIIEAEMSYAQFAEAITSMNMGTGIPITLVREQGKGIPQTDFVNKRLQFEQEFEQSMGELEERISQLTEKAEDILTNKKTVSKGDRDVILKELRSVKQQVAANLPFVQSQFNEQMDKTVQAAKSEVEAFTMRKVTELGLSSIEQLKNLEHPQPVVLIDDSTNDKKK